MFEVNYPYHNTDILTCYDKHIYQSFYGTLSQEHSSFCLFIQNRISEGFYFHTSKKQGIN